MPMRNPFKKAGGFNDENERPGNRDGLESGFEPSQVSGQSKSSSSALNIRNRQDDEPAEYKMSGLGAVDGDISAKSPVPYPTPPRQSLDARQSLEARRAHGTKPAVGPRERNIDRQPPTAEEGFEDVGLNDEIKPKRRSIFSRFGDTSTDTGAPPNSSSTTGGSHLGFSFASRKRGHSGHGAELGKMDRNERPASRGMQAEASAG
ncbi:MAG: hypothetical protein M1825_004242 [Sarcosagium campestre]|nr:MAG: hypothetical protein M1825_004242 [Sarcosagium campestre]